MRTATFWRRTDSMSASAACSPTLDVDDVERLAEVGKEIRGWMLATPFPPRLQDEILASFREMAQMGSGWRACGRGALLRDRRGSARSVVRRDSRRPSSTCAARRRCCSCMHEVYASLFNDRAIAYRVHHNFDHNAVALSVGVQTMVRSDLGSAGVMFTLDTDSGFRDVVFITSAYGLGETVVQGAVNPDEFYVYKPALRAGRRAVVRKNIGTKAIKMIYAEPGSKERVRTVDVPGGRPRAVLSRGGRHRRARQAGADHRGALRRAHGHRVGQGWQPPARSTSCRRGPRPCRAAPAAPSSASRSGRDPRVIITGRSIGQRIGAGPARIIKDVKEMSRVRAGDVLVADMTDPDWEPVMKRASAIVTNRGGRTCHAAIIARELGIPAVVGCGTATSDDQRGPGRHRVLCAEGDTGYVYEGHARVRREAASSSTRCPPSP